MAGRDGTSPEEAYHLVVTPGQANSATESSPESNIPRLSGATGRVERNLSPFGSSLATRLAGAYDAQDSARDVHSELFGSFGRDDDGEATKKQQSQSWRRRFRRCFMQWRQCFTRRPSPRSSHDILPISERNGGASDHATDSFSIFRSPIVKLLLIVGAVASFYVLLQMTLFKMVYVQMRPFSEEKNISLSNVPGMEVGLFDMRVVNMLNATSLKGDGRSNEGYYLKNVEAYVTQKQEENSHDAQAEQSLKADGKAVGAEEFEASQREELVAADGNDVVESPGISKNAVESASAGVDSEVLPARLAEGDVAHKLEASQRAQDIHNDQVDLKLGEAQAAAGEALDRNAEGEEERREVDDQDNVAERKKTFTVPEDWKVKPSYKADEAYQLQWVYDADEKAWPYVGHPRWLEEFRDVYLEGIDKSAALKSKDDVVQTRIRHYYNSLAVFPNADESSRMHGILGIAKDGAAAWKPDPMPPKAEDVEGGVAAALKNGGFYLNLSDALPLDRDAVDGRQPFCKTIQYEFTDLEDASIIITFFNEPLSTLLRSLHSALNRTPPPLLREIILVDDHSTLEANRPGGDLYEYIRLLPKVKLMRLPERRGLVMARLAGIQMATAPVVVVLDSHIEVNDGWLEPQLLRLSQSPKSIVFPQIMAIDAENFDFLNYSGIGCFLSYKWMMQERAYLDPDIKTPDPVASPSMAGGLFAVRREWFWELGGYDEEFSMWGAENVEMGFRVWLCGGRMECMPCARVYHIYREKGVGYSSPSDAVERNRLRTARLWTDEYFQLAKYFITSDPAEDLGNFDKMLELKERLHCKPFQWYLDNVDPNKRPRSLSEVQVLGEIRSSGFPNMCLDTLGHHDDGDEYGVFGCHNQGGTQGFLTLLEDPRIYLTADETHCIGTRTITNCEHDQYDAHWRLDETTKQIRWSGPVEDAILLAEADTVEARGDEKCLTLVMKDGKHELKLASCREEDEQQLWKWKRFELDPHFEPLQFSEEHQKKRAIQRAAVYDNYTKPL